MEQHDTTYLFVIDGEHYHGCISLMGIAGALAHLADQDPHTAGG
jgi:hypothetical protein